MSRRISPAFKFDMAVIKSGQESIYYFEKGEGTPVIFLHGFTLDSRQWPEQIEYFSQTHRVIVFDARGHGKSDKPHESDRYDLKSYAGDVVAVLDDLGVDSCHYLGFSMGGRIGFGLAHHWPDRVRSLVSMDGNPYPRDMTGTRAASESLESWVPEMANITPAHEARLLGNDPQALVAAAIAQHQVDASEVLKRIAVPCLVLASGPGESPEGFDRVKRCAEEISGSTYVCFEEFDHVDLLVRSDAVLPHIVPFLSSAS